MEIETLVDEPKINKKGVILVLLSVLEGLFCALFIEKIGDSNLIVGSLGEDIYYGMLISIALWFIIKLVLIMFNKKVLAIIMMSITLLFCGALFFYINFEYKVDSLIIKMSRDSEVSTSSVIVTKDNSILTLNNLEGKVIGFLNNEESQEGYIIVHDELEKNNINYVEEKADSYAELIAGLNYDLYDAVVLPSNYRDIFTIEGELTLSFEGFIDAITLEKVVEEEKVDIDFGEPFSILLLGTDNPLSVNSFNYDSINLVTFNLEAKHMVVTSIFRGTGMYSPCIGGADLVTHNGWGGKASCAIRTIENFFDIDIDAAITMDFKGFVDIVDALGGIDVDVPKEFCEQNSDRSWGSNTICLEAGEQHIDGEEALAFARHRKTIGGVQRAENQSQILTNIGNKLFTSDLLFSYNKLFNIISDNIKTDMTSDDIYEFYEMMVNFADEVDYSFDSVTLTTQTTNGYDRLLYSPSVGCTMAINQITKDSYFNIKNTLHSVLYNEVKPINSFSFDLGEDPNYDSKKFLDTATKNELKLIFNDPRVMPNLVGKNKEEAYKYDSRYAIFNLYVNYAYSDKYAKDIIVYQSIPAGEGLNHRYNLTVTVSKGPEGTTPVVEEVPIITLTGSSTINLNVGDTYTDPGYSATYNEEDVTDQVVVNGSVNTEIPDTYIITYNLDIEGSVAEEKTRTVIVSEEDTTPPDNPVISMVGNTATITYSEDSTTKMYRVTSDEPTCVVSWTTYSSPYSCDSSYTIEAYAKDESDNQSDTVTDSYVSE